ncbi:MAG: response regulator [Bryobacteraceae bacterium]|jgi:CheY-like chemotaxis protein
MADESGSNPHRGKEPPSSSPSPDTPDKPFPRPLSLLLAEDNLPDALFLREAIKAEDLPLEVHIAPDGEQAIDFIARAEKDPDAPCPHVLLLDLNLPKVDGFEVLRRIRASDKWKNIPVLIVTSSDSPADRSEAARLGVSYFRKPVTYEEFVKVGPVLRQFLKDNGLL